MAESLMPAIIVGLGGLAFSLLMAINGAYNLAKAAGGIYSTVTDAGTSYDKAEAFAHDVALMMMSVSFLKGAVALGTKSLSTCKSAAQELIGRTTRVKPLEVIQGAKGIGTITSLEEFLECVKGFLDEDALQYAEELLNNDADDIVELKKIARLLEEGSKKIGKKLSKEEFKAGLDALWGDGGVEGALGAIERIFKGGLKPDGIKTWDEINNILNKAGLDENKVNEILSLPKGSRPDPKTYLSEEYIESHLSNFQNGVTKIKSKPPVDTEGVGLGTFVMPKSVADDVIMRAEGNVSKLEKLLGLNPGDLGKNPVRVDIENPHNIRIPSGNEAGAWPGYWTPGGYTKPGGVMEAVIDPVPKSEYKITKYILKER